MREIRLGNDRDHAMLCALLARHGGAVRFTENDLAAAPGRVVSHVEPCSGLWELKLLNRGGEPLTLPSQDGSDG